MGLWLGAVQGGSRLGGLDLNRLHFCDVARLGLHFSLLTCLSWAL